MMKKFFYLLAIAVVVAGCQNRRNLLPKVSGKAGEIIVVMDKDSWEGNTGNQVRELLAGDCPWLAQREPLYSLVNVAPGGFADLFKVHRNILFFEMTADTTKRGVSFMKDIWATPQCVITISAGDANEAAEYLVNNSSQILNTIEQAERDRVIRNCLLYEEKKLAPIVIERFGGSPHFPSGYKPKKGTDDFVWIADEKQYSNQGIFIYSYPATLGEDEFKLENIIAKRNEIMKANVPGMLDNSWMTTSLALPPTIEYLKYRGRDFAQVRGLWEVENDFMGGPFVSQSFYSKDGTKVIVAEAFVFAPRYDKRQYLRQVESILYSWEWSEEAEK